MCKKGEKNDKNYCFFDSVCAVCDSSNNKGDTIVANIAAEPWPVDVLCIALALHHVYLHMYRRTIYTIHFISFFSLLFPFCLRACWMFSVDFAHIITHLIWYSKDKPNENKQKMTNVQKNRWDGWTRTVLPRRVHSIYIVIDEHALGTSHSTDSIQGESNRIHSFTQTRKRQIASIDWFSSFRISSSLIWWPIMMSWRNTMLAQKLFFFDPVVSTHTQFSQLDRLFASITGGIQHSMELHICPHHIEYMSIRLEIHRFLSLWWWT